MAIIHSGPYSVDVRRRTIPKGGAAVMLDGEHTGLYVTWITEFSMRKSASRRVRNLKPTSFLTLTYAGMDTGINHGTSARDVARAIRHDHDSTLHFRLGRCADFSHLTIKDSYGSLLSRAFSFTFGTGNKPLEKPPVILDHQGRQYRIDLNHSNTGSYDFLENSEAGTAFFDKLQDGEYRVTLV